MDPKNLKFASPEAYSLKALVKGYYHHQDIRKRIDGNMSRTKAGNAKKGSKPMDQGMLFLLADSRANSYETELQLAKFIEETIAEVPMWKDYLKDVKGIGPISAAVLLTQFDVTVDKPEGWIKYSGLAPGHHKKVAKQKLKYNAFLKSQLLSMIAMVLATHNTYYGAIYQKELKTRQDTDWGIPNPTSTLANKKQGHQVMTARRVMMQHFINDLYKVWRTMEGLPVLPNYIERMKEKRLEA